MEVYRERRNSSSNQGVSFENHRRNIIRPLRLFIVNIRGSRNILEQITVLGINEVQGVGERRAAPDWSKMELEVYI